MTSVTQPTATIVRTERGLTISGTRITLYDVMDYAGEYPTKFISSLFGLNEDQIQVALDYISENQAEVEAEYQQVLQQAAESQQYWQERKQEHLAKIAAAQSRTPKSPFWEKLQAQKAKHELEAQALLDRSR